MKKLVSTILLSIVLTVAAFADDGSPGATTCVAGHINSPGVVCTPPSEGNGQGNRAISGEGEDSVVNVVRAFVSELYTLFGG